MKEIQLTQGKVAIVDDEDFEWLNAFTWCIAKGYALRREYLGCGKYKSVRMHRLIMGLDINDGIQVDHKDRNKLNNQKNNLRICDTSKNKANSVAYSNNKSGYKGVYKNNRSGKYVAQIRVMGELFYLGTFSDPSVAFIAYCDAALKYHGAFANVSS